MPKDHDGYTFEGWYVNSDLTQKVNPGGILPAEIHLYPKWSVEKYPVYYELDEGMNSPYNPHELQATSHLVKLYPATAPDRQFVGWYLDGKRVEYLDGSRRQTLHLVGRFRDPVLIHFETNGGGRLTDAKAGANGRLDKWPVPIKIGCRFAGWYLDQALRIPCEEDHDFEEETVLYAKWDLVRYKVFYDLDGGQFDETPIRSFTSRSATFLLPKVSRPGYDFEGWKDQKGHLRLMVRHGTINNRSFKASWKPHTTERFKIREDETEN